MNGEIKSKNHLFSRTFCFPLSKDRASLSVTSAALNPNATNESHDTFSLLNLLEVQP
jgi:hypothetical protein